MASWRSIAACTIGTATTPATGTASLAPAASAKPRMCASNLPETASAPRTRQFGERDGDRGGSRSHQRVDQRLAAIVGGLEAVARLR